MDMHEAVCMQHHCACRSAYACVLVRVRKSQELLFYEPDFSDFSCLLARHS